jgi:hypothetical protein
MRLMQLTTATLNHVALFLLLSPSSLLTRVGTAWLPQSR